MDLQKNIEVARLFTKTPIELIPARTEDFDLMLKDQNCQFFLHNCLKKYKINPSNWQQGLHKVIKIYKKTNDRNFKNIH